MRPVFDVIRYSEAPEEWQRRFEPKTPIDAVIVFEAAWQENIPAQFYHFLLASLNARATTRTHEGVKGTLIEPSGKRKRRDNGEPKAAGLKAAARIWTHGAIEQSRTICGVNFEFLPPSHNVAKNASAMTINCEQCKREAAKLLEEQMRSNE